MPATALQSPPASHWDAIDRLYCITLADRPDRRRTAEEQFARVGLADRVEFFVAQRHPTDSEQGIYESHMHCLRQGLAAGADTIAVFEDDILFDRFSPRSLAHAAAFLRNGTPWDAFFFGCFARSSRQTSSPSVLQITYQCGAHAYALSRPFAEALVQIPWRGTAFDDLLRAQPAARYFAACPSFAFQSNTPSDNHKMAPMMRFWNSLGGLHRLQRWNEFRHRHMAAILLANTALLLLLALLLYLALR